ncbi:MAG: ribonuclease P/MRP protein subunit POP5 [Haloarculaceae archaeon]|jgi:ribonuclease P/MRP protein subunit POP5
MKHLPKHLRQRWRYLAVGIEAWPDASLDRATVQRGLWYAARDLVGDAGSARLDLTVLSVDFTEGAGEAVVRTRRGEVEPARAVVASVTSVDGHDVALRVRGVSGTVRACEEKYMGRGPKEPEQRHVVFRDAERSATVRDGRLDVRIDDAFAGATTLE